MSYTPTTWTTGDTITASAMNKIEQGVANAGSALIVNMSLSNRTLDKTYAEIYTALREGIPCYIKIINGSADPSGDYAARASMNPIIGAYKYNDDYRIYALDFEHRSYNNVYFYGTPATLTFMVSSINDYPEYLGTVYVVTASTAVTSGGPV